MNIGIKQLADIAGVSIGTVDRALHNRSGIDPVTKDRILSVARELHYRPHYLARSLANGASMTLGVVVYDLKNFFFSELVEVIEAKARALNYYVYLMLSHKDLEQEIESLDHLRGLNVDGIIMVPINWGSSFDRYLRGLDCPIVTISNRISKNWPWVGIDDYAAMGDAVRYLAAKGYERIVYVSPNVAGACARNLSSADQRLLGYQNALRENPALGGPVAVDSDEVRGILELMGDFRAQKTCVLCSADIQALDVLNVLKQNGIRIPQDVGLMGCDNIDVLDYIAPRLTTIAFSIKDIGSRAFDCMIGQIDGGPAESVVLTHTIVDGEST